MPALIGAAVLPLIVNSPIFYNGPLTLHRWDGMPDRQTRGDFLDAVFLTQQTTAATAAHLRPIRDAVEAAVSVTELTLADEDQAPNKQRGSVIEAFGECLAPFASAATLGVSAQRPVEPGEIAATIWCGVPWKMAKIYLGRQGDRVFFCQTSPAVIYDVAAEDVIQCEALPVGAGDLRARLPEMLRTFAERLEPSPLDVRPHPNLDYAQGIALTDIIECARALPIGPPSKGQGCPSHSLACLLRRSMAE